MKALGFDEEKEEVLAILRKYGTPIESGSSRILLSYDKFQAVLGEKIKARDPLVEIKRAFLLFARTRIRTKEGKRMRVISMDDLLHVSKELGENLAMIEIEAMIKEFALELLGQTVNRVSEGGEVSEKDEKGGMFGMYLHLCLQSVC